MEWLAIRQYLREFPMYVLINNVQDAAALTHAASVAPDAVAAYLRQFKKADICPQFGEALANKYGCAWLGYRKAERGTKAGQMVGVFSDDKAGQACSKAFRRMVERAWPTKPSDAPEVDAVAALVKRVQKLSGDDQKRLRKALGWSLF